MVIQIKPLSRSSAWYKATVLANGISVSTICCNFARIAVHVHYIASLSQVSTFLDCSYRITPFDITLAHYTDKLKPTEPFEKETAVLLDALKRQACQKTENKSQENTGSDTSMKF